MALLHDEDDVIRGQGVPGARMASAADYLPPQPPAQLPHYGPDETIAGLECHYGTFAYRYSSDSAHNHAERSRRPACHNPTGTPAERHRCAACGGYYCSVHAAPADHDCTNVIPPG